jgi:hypothetical protein
MEVDTLGWVLSHLDATTSPGISGMGYDMLKHVKPGVLRPLLAAFFGQGFWNYEKFLETEGQRSYYQIDTHALMISVVGVALNKDGKPLVRSEPVDNLRPICIGESIRRIAARCQLLQCESSVGEKLAKNGQYGCGFARGTATVYHTISKCLDALTAEQVRQLALLETPQKPIHAKGYRPPARSAAGLQRLHGFEAEPAVEAGLLALAFGDVGVTARAPGARSACGLRFFELRGGGDLLEPAFEPLHAQLEVLHSNSHVALIVVAATDCHRD